MAVRISAEAHRYRATIASPPTSNQWSVAFWIKPVATTGRIWSLNNASTGADEMLFSESSEFRLIAGDTGHTGPAATAGVWHYVGYSNNGASGVWVIRTLTATSFTVLTWSDGSASSNQFSRLALGDHYDGGVPMDGSLAAFRWWSASLSQAELEAECFRQMPSRTAGLRGWYPLIRTTDLADLSGNGNTLTGGTGAAQDDGPGIPWRQGSRSPLIPGEIPANATPAPVAAPVAMPAPAVSLTTTVSPAAIPVTVALPTPQIFVGGGVVPVDPPAIAVPVAVPAPDVSTVKQVFATPGAIPVVAALPDPAVSVPVTPGDDLDGKGQISYNGFKIGGGTPYRLHRVDGSPWDMPGLDQGDEPHPSADGELPGQDFAQARVMTAELLIKAPKGEIEAVCDAFTIGLPKAVADERLPIAVQVIDRIWVGYGRVTQRRAAMDKPTPIGHVKAYVQFTMSDPRFYSRELANATVADGGFVDVVNAGNTATPPRYRMRGPAIQPQVEVVWTDLDATEHTRVIEYDVEVAADEIMIIDVQRGTAMIGDESVARARLNGTSTIPDMVLQPRISRIYYSTADGTAPPLQAFWNHAII